MKQREFAILPIPTDWKPEDMAERIVHEAEDWWNKGWIFVDATTDTLMENVVLQFERDL